MTGHADPETLTAIVAIDGPAGAGKSTIARGVAEALGFAFLDTGAMYRAATWNVMNRGIDFADEDAVTEATCSARIDVQDIDGAQRVSVDDTDITEAIRSADVTERIRLLSNNPGVREHLVTLQRNIGAQRPTVAEGRDMGSVVFPQARCKIFLDASIDERARRRYEELVAKGQAADLKEIRDAVARRDDSDRNRVHGPLIQADDAEVIDSTALTPDAVVAAIVSRAKAMI